MDANTPITLAAGKYHHHDQAVDDFNTVWDARRQGDFDHTMADLLESGQSGLVVVAVNRTGTDIEPLLKRPDKTVVTNTTWGDLDAEIEKELAAAQTKPSTS